MSDETTGSFKDYLDSIAFQQELESDPIQPHIDVQNTTMAAAQRYMVKNIFTQNISLQGLKEGVIIKIINNKELFDYSSKYQLDSYLMQNNKPVTSSRYKVFLKSVMGIIDIAPYCPSDSAAFFMPDYVLSDEAINKAADIKIGTTVLVDERSKTIVIVKPSIIDTSTISCFAGRKKDIFAKPSIGISGGKNKPGDMDANKKGYSRDIGKPMTQPADRIELLPDTKDQIWHPPLIGRYKLTSPFNAVRDIFHTGEKRTHKGLDIGAVVGTTVYATADGFISEHNTVNVKSTCGFYVVLNVKVGNDVYYIRHCHMDSVSVLPNQKIKRGDILGYTGNTGPSTGPHLHYAIGKNGRWGFIDPRSLNKIIDAWSEIPESGQYFTLYPKGG